MDLLLALGDLGISDPLPDRIEARSRAALNHEIDRAARGADFHRARSSALMRRRWRRRRPTALLGLAALVVIPGVALAATQLVWTDSQVAASLPQGARALAGTEPTCTTVIANVEYHCTLAKPPSSMSGAPTATTTSGKEARVPFLELTRTLRNHHALALLGVHHVIRFALVSKGGRRVLVISGQTIPPLTIPLPYLASRPFATTTTDWRGAVEATVDTSRRVNGGCRALNPAGTEWECYIGEPAVTQKIISQGFLGQYAPTPGVG